MPIVPMSEFHPRTGAYWKGYKDAYVCVLFGTPKCYPLDWDAKAISDYNEGWSDNMSGLDDQPQAGGPPKDAHHE